MAATPVSRDLEASARGAGEADGDMRHAHQEPDASGSDAAANGAAPASGAAVGAAGGAGGGRDPAYELARRLREGKEPEAHASTDKVESKLHEELMRRGQSGRMESSAERRESLRNLERRYSDPSANPDASGAANAATERRTDEPGLHAQVSDDERVVRRGALREAFAMFDADSSGFVGPGEVQSLLLLVGERGDPDSVRATCEALGAQPGGDGRVAIAGFLAALEKYVRGFTPANKTALYRIFSAVQQGEVRRIRTAFDACDEDRSNKIDAKELRAVLGALGEKLTDAELERVFADLDSDKDGYIDFVDFVRFICLRRGASAQGGPRRASFMDPAAPVDKAEVEEAMRKMPFLERLGANYMHAAYDKSSKRDQKAEAGANGGGKRAERLDLHVLTKAERKAIRRVELLCIFLDMLFGAISAVVSGVAEVIAGDEWDTDGNVDGGQVNDPSWPSIATRILYFWLVVGLVSLFISIVEIVAIYYVHLRCTVRIAQLTGLQLFPANRERAFVAAALARAALELPHPERPEQGVDPLEEASKLKLFIAAMLYKAKTGLSTFILRLVVKRVLTRMAVKSVLAFVAVPVNMFFNGLIGYKCLRAARVVALGPSAALEVIRSLLGTRPVWPLAMKKAILRAEAATITSVQMMHPNLNILLKATQDTLGLHINTEELKVAVPSKDAAVVLNPQDAAAMRQASLKVETELRAEEEKSGLGGDSKVELQEVRAHVADVEASDSRAPIIAREDGHAQQQQQQQQQPRSKSHGAAAAAPPSSDATTADAKALAEPVREEAEDEGDDDEELDGSASTLAQHLEKDPNRAQRKLENEQSNAIPRPGNRKRFYQALLDLDDMKDREFVVMVLVFSMVLTGNVTGTLLKLFRRAASVANVSADPMPLHWLTARFIRGEMTSQDVLDILDEKVRSQNKSSGCKARLAHCCDRTLVCLSC